jgi:hypothetical protein
MRPPVKVRVRSLDAAPNGCAVGFVAIWLCAALLGLFFWGVVVYVLIKLAASL